MVRYCPGVKSYAVRSSRGTSKLTHTALSVSRLTWDTRREWNAMRGRSAMGRVLLLWLLVDAEDVAGGIGEPRDDLRRVGAERPYDGAARLDDGLGGLLRVVDHDVDQQADVAHGRPVGHPRAADLPVVVEGGRAVTAG